MRYKFLNPLIPSEVEGSRATGEHGARCLDFARHEREGVFGVIAG